MKSEIGVIGLGTMGRALALNFLSRDYTVSGYNRTFEVTQQLKQKSTDKFNACQTLEEFVESLQSPRKIIMMLPAGKITDMQIKALIPLLDKGDILADGGNAFFKDTERRSNEITPTGILYFGVGVSGGEKGALLGPSIMPGGDEKAYANIAPYLEKISAKKNGAACCAYIGTGGAGHFVKMVHNGIEYADLQLLAEFYLICKYMYNMSNSEMALMFDEWNKTEAKSYLVEITSDVLKEQDYDNSGDLIDKIADYVGAKGTGQWTCQSALELGSNVSIIQAAVEARGMSQLKQQRKFFEKNMRSFTALQGEKPDKDALFGAYMLCKTIAYAQGFAMMNTAAIEYNKNLNLGEIAKIFRAGCIIQAELLEVIMNVFESEQYKENMLMHPDMLKSVCENLPKLKALCTGAVNYSLPTPALFAALTYINQLSSPQLGAKLISAQRDYFGAHTFERTDREGFVHHEWKN